MRSLPVIALILCACGGSPAQTRSAPPAAAAEPTPAASPEPRASASPDDIALLNVMEIAEPQAHGLRADGEGHCVLESENEGELAEERDHLLGQTEVERFCVRRYVRVEGEPTRLRVIAMRFESSDAAIAAAGLDSFEWLGARLEHLGLEVGRAGPLVFFVHPDQQPAYAAAAEVWPNVARRLKEYAAELR